jgi:hypothetical protein
MARRPKGGLLPARTLKGVDTAAEEVAISHVVALTYETIRSCFIKGNKANLSLRELSTMLGIPSRVVESLCNVMVYYGWVQIHTLKATENTVASKYVGLRYTKEEQPGYTARYKMALVPEMEGKGEAAHAYLKVRMTRQMFDVKPIEPTLVEPDMSRAVDRADPLSLRSQKKEAFRHRLVTEEDRELPAVPFPELSYYWQRRKKKLRGRLPKAPMPPI